MGTKPQITNLEQSTEAPRGHQRRFDDWNNTSTILESVTDAIIIANQDGCDQPRNRSRTIARQKNQKAVRPEDRHR